MAEQNQRGGPTASMCKAQFPDVLKAVRGARYPAIFEVNWALREIEVDPIDAEPLGTSLDASVTSAFGVSPAASGRVSFECPGAERAEALVAQLLEALGGPRPAPSSPERCFSSNSRKSSPRAEALCKSCNGTGRDTLTGQPCHCKAGVKEQKQPLWGWSNGTTPQSHNGPSLLESQRGLEGSEWPCFGRKEACEPIEESKPASVHSHSSSPPKEFSLSMEMAWDSGSNQSPSSLTNVVSRPVVQTEPVARGPFEPVAGVSPNSYHIGESCGEARAPHGEARAPHTSPRLDSPPWTLHTPSVLPERGVEPTQNPSSLQAEAARWTLSGIQGTSESSREAHALHSARTSDTLGWTRSGPSPIGQNGNEERASLQPASAAGWTLPSRSLGNESGREACTPQGLLNRLPAPFPGTGAEPVVKPVEHVGNHSEEAANGRPGPWSACTRDSPQRTPLQSSPPGSPKSSLRSFGSFGTGGGAVSSAIPTLPPRSEVFSQHQASNGRSLQAEAPPSGRCKMEELRKRYGLNAQSHHSSVPPGELGRSGNTEPIACSPPPLPAPKNNDRQVPRRDSFGARPRDPSPLVFSNNVEGLFSGGNTGGAVSSGGSSAGSSAGGTAAPAERKWATKWAESPTISKIEAFRRDILTGTPREKAHLGAEGSKIRGLSPSSFSAAASPAHGPTEPIEASTRMWTDAVGAAASIGGRAVTAAAAAARQESPAHCGRPPSSVPTSPRLGFSIVGGASNRGADLATNREPCDAGLAGTPIKGSSGYSTSGSGIRGLLGTQQSRTETGPINDRFRQMLRGRGLDGSTQPGRFEGIPSARCVELQ